MSEHKYLTKKLANLERLATTDELSEVYNYRYFQNALASEIYRAKRYKRPLSLMVIDIDDFKVVNDEEGHKEGDKLIKELADILLANTRKSNIVCRYGGDEFVIILPETNYNNTRKLAIRLKKLIYEKVVMKVSIGIGSFPRHGKTIKGLFNYADRKMFKDKVKENGR